MKHISVFLIVLVLFSSCKSDKTNDEVSNPPKDLTVGEKIAYAHGFENWKNVSEVRFTFKVDRDSIKGKGRSWVWRPKENKIKMTTADRTFEYVRHEMDSTYIAADRAFINDKFWLLVPFQLVWDTSATITGPIKEESPINKILLDKITLSYPQEGGYTPGDAYDIYFDEDYTIREWTFRKGNSSTPTLSNTFENYKDFNGIKIAIDHKRGNGNWNLNFADLSITLD